jgi:signal transduction histidine kinase/DNA-binding response OmpR family regulator
MEDLRPNPAIEDNPASRSNAMAPTFAPRNVSLAVRPLQLLDALPEGVCAIDPLGQVVYVNPEAARLLARDPGEMLGTALHELLHGAAPDDLRCTPECPLFQLGVEQEPASGEDAFYQPDHSSFPAEFTLTPMEAQPGVSVFSFRDIGQRAAVNRIKDEFVSTVSHELRTPLTSIRGALGLLSSGMLGPLSDKAANLLRIALSNSERLVRLINDILDLERIQSGREPLSFHTVDLAELVRQAIDGMAPMAEAAGVKLIHDATAVELAADPDRVLQVLTNLLSNAVKFSPPNSTVSVMLRPGVTGVILSVIDHGRGIPADKLEAIFGRFQQVDASDSRQKGGSGLGLAICRTIVQQHFGRIWAERNPVRGSTFRVYLPYRPASVEAELDLPVAETGHGTVLLAGAGEEARPCITGLLTRHGYKVIEAATVDQTLAAARRMPQAILLDTSLDGMNGWQILPKLRQLDPESRTPVVLLSVDEPVTEASTAIDVAGWVPKPRAEEMLLGELARVLCGPGEQTRILVVEDDRDLAGVIREVFARDRILVELAYSYEQTLELCPRFQPHLIVLDIGLPDGDGFNVVDWLRQHEALARLPLVVYSGRTLSTSERHQLTLGPTHFLTKACVQPQQLEALVLTLLRRSRQG